MRVGIGIVAHHARLQMAERLSRSIKADVISIDPGTIGAGSNHRRVWAELSTYDTDWSVVLEDDALPVPDFRDQLTAALAAAPTAIVSGYLGQLRPPRVQPQISEVIARAYSTGSHWITANDLFHAVGVAVRTELLDDMLTRLRADMPIDQAIGNWARKRGHEIAYCWPSLVDHADTETLIQHPDGHPRTPGRVAWKTGTRPHWSSKSVPL